MQPGVYDDLSDARMFRIEAENFMSQGASIAFLSVFPNEAEVLYPPLTYWSLIRVEPQQLAKDLTATVAVVKPNIS